MYPSIDTPYDFFHDKDGDALDDGYIYIGQPNQNPETAPLQVFWDTAGTQPAAQPIRTLNGYPVHFGTPANIFAPGPYSISVKNKRGTLIYYAPDARAWTGKFSDWLSVKDFGAVGNGVADDTVAIQAAVDAAGARATGGCVFFPDGLYKLTATINVPKSYVTLMGASKDSVQLFRTTAYGPMFYFGTGGTTLVDGCGINNLRLIDNGTNNNSGNAIEVENASRFTSDNLTLFGGTNGIILRGAANVEISNVYMFMQNAAAPSANRHGIRVIATTIVGAPVVFGSNVALTNVHIYGGDNVAASYANLESCLEVEAVDGLWITGCYFGGAERADMWLTRINAAHTCGNIYVVNTMWDICRGNGILIGGTQLHQRLRFEGSVSCVNVGVAGKDGVYITGPTDSLAMALTVDGWKGNGVHFGATGGTFCNNVSLNGSVITGNLGYGVQIEANTGTNQIIVSGCDLAGNTVGSVNDLTATTTLKSLDGNLAYGVPWTTYTPTVTSGGGSITAVATGRYRKIGSTVDVQMRITSVSADTGTGFVQLTLPTAAGLPTENFALAANEGTTNASCTARISGSSLNVALLKYDGTYPSAVGRTFVISGCYQVP